jgi:hypothetical protein
MLLLFSRIWLALCVFASVCWLLGLGEPSQPVVQGPVLQRSVIIPEPDEGTCTITTETDGHYTWRCAYRIPRPQERMLCDKQHLRCL